MLNNPINQYPKNGFIMSLAAKLSHTRPRRQLKSSSFDKEGLSLVKKHDAPASGAHQITTTAHLPKLLEDMHILKATNNAQRSHAVKDYQSIHFT
jgi:hypothetical protein